MVRPTGSPTNRRIALEFAKLVTRPTGNDDDLVARCGRCCLFSTLQETYPSLARAEYGGARDGLSEVEFNKLLQASGFRRVRNRKAGASNRAQDPLGAGLYMFSGIRWLDPDEPHEVKLLASGLAHLALKFPQLGGFTSGGLEGILAILRRNRRWWEENAWQRARRRQARQQPTAGSFIQALTFPNVESIRVSRLALSRGTAGDVMMTTSDFALSADSDASNGSWSDDRSDSSSPPLRCWPRAAGPFGLCSDSCSIGSTDPPCSWIIANSSPTDLEHSLNHLEPLSEPCAPPFIAVAPPVADTQGSCWRWAWEDGELWPAAAATAEWRL